MITFIQQNGWSLLVETYVSIHLEHMYGIYNYMYYLQLYCTHHYTNGYNSSIRHSNWKCNIVMLISEQVNCNLD